MVINVYCPNAGPAPERPRLAIKMRFLEALKRKADTLASAGREARRTTICPDLAQNHHPIQRLCPVQPLELHVLVISDWGSRPESN